MWQSGKTSRFENTPGRLSDYPCPPIIEDYPQNKSLRPSFQESPLPETLFALTCISPRLKTRISQNLRALPLVSQSTLARFIGTRLPNPLSHPSMLYRSFEHVLELGQEHEKTTRKFSSTELTKVNEDECT